MKISEEMFKNKCVKFIKSNLKDKKDEQAMGRIIAYIDGELEYRQIEKMAFGRFKKPIKSKRIDEMLIHVDREKALRVFKLLVEFSEIQSAKIFYEDFRKEWAQSGKSDEGGESLDAFIDILESLQARESYIYGFLLSSMYEKRNRPSAAPLCKYSKRLGDYADEGRLVIESLRFSDNETRIAAIYEVGLFESQLPAVVDMLKSPSAEVVQAALKLVELKSQDELSGYEKAIEAGRLNLAELTKDSPAEVIEKLLSSYSLEGLEISLREDSKIKRWSSKAGGKPYLPIGEEYPAEGMKLLAQINFEEMEKLEGYPEKGILQFYVVADEEDYYYKHKVKYFETIIKDEGSLEDDLPYMSEDDVDPVFFRELKMDFKKVVQSPEVYHYLYGDEIRRLIGQNFEDEDKRDYFIDEHGSMRSERRVNMIGGYPYFIDMDPREYDDMLGEFGGEFGEVSLDNEWVSLFTLYDRDIPKEYGRIPHDEGAMYFFIRKRDLQNSNFDDVKYHRFTY